jgi:peptide/nickel transport system substrate-binding protein
MKVRLLSCISLLVILGLLVSACGGTPVPPTSAPPAEATKAPEPTAPPVAEATKAPEPTATTPPEPTAAPAVPSGGDVIFAGWQSPDTLDPNATGLISAMKVDIHIFEPLIWFYDGQYYPGLATSWEINDDSTEYTFHLRQGVKFQDETPFNADAVAAMFDHVLNEETKALGAISALGPYDHNEVVDDYTIKVFFKEPNAAFLNQISSGNLMINSPTNIEKWGHAEVGRHPVGTGPFKFVEWVEEDHVTVEKWDEYNWAPDFYDHQGPAYVDSFTYKIIPEPATRVATLETGETNLIEDVTPEDLDHFRESPDQYTIYLPNSSGMPYAMWLNVINPPTDDINVRKAILYAANQGEIIDALYHGMYEPAYTPLDPSTQGYDPSFKDMYQYDPDKAEGLLDDAGWVDSDGDGIRDKDGQPLVIHYVDLAGFGFEEMAVLLQANLKKVGIDMEITAESFPAVQDTYHAGDKHNMCPFFFYFTDITALESLYTCAAVDRFNWSHICLPEIDDLINQLYVVGDPDARVQLIHDLQQVLMDQAFIIGLYEKRGVMVGTAAMQGLKFQTQAYPLYYDVYFK